MSRKFIHDVNINRNEFFSYLHIISEEEGNLFVRGNMLEILKRHKDEFSAEGYKSIREVFRYVQESVCIGNTVYLNVRERVAREEFYLFNLENVFFEEIDVLEYLKAKERFVNPNATNDILTLNFKPYYDKFPSVRDPKNIGKGVEYLNRYLSSQMFNDGEKWRELLLNFIKLHKYNSQQLIVNERITDADLLSNNIERAIDYLKKVEDDEPYEELQHKLQDLGFEKGLGSTASEIIESLKLLDTLIHSPDNNSLTQFLSRIPMIFKIAVISVHGYFAQEGVLGKPDTGGQVVYILDQVKALEKSLADSLQKAGMGNIKPKIIILSRLIPSAADTTCNQRLEKVHDTENTWILRVPFRTHNPDVTDSWISRFEIWPYLEEFSEDAYRELYAEFGGRPDLLIGNYSDGNIVSYILSRKFGVTQCCIAHALEKSKYLYSALYWKDLEKFYNFSVQFTADLISMNSADFLITSTYQEITGNTETIGQYESYKQFIMPELFRVAHGINLYHPKFNVVSPGVNEKIYFPYSQEEDRITSIRESLKKLLFENAEDPDVIGRLENPEKTPIFSMARLDKIKNLTAMVRWFGKSPEMQELSNLIIVAGNVDPEKSNDQEEVEQINAMHDLINKYELHDKIRWIGKLFRKDQAGEVYRTIAEHKGIFIQPALFEGFGLTVLEAMRSGLPVFATYYGGPLEIIEDTINGFHIDPVNDEETIDKIVRFLKRSQKTPSYWNRISKKAIKRVNESYNWKLYSTNLISQAKIYGFWRYVKDIEMTEMNSYLDMFYHLMYKPLAKNILIKHSGE